MFSKLVYIPGQSVKNVMDCPERQANGLAAEVLFMVVKGKWSRSKAKNSMIQADVFLCCK